MTDLHKRSLFKVAAMSALAAAVLIGCGKKEEAAAPAPAPAPAAPAAAPAPEAPQELQLMGLTLQPLTAESAEALGMPKDAKGLAVTDVDEASEAFTKGLRAGDVITEAGQQAVSRVEDLEARLQPYRRRQGLPSNAPSHVTPCD